METTLRQLKEKALSGEGVSKEEAILDLEETLKAARMNERERISRFSLVTSGRMRLSHDSMLQIMTGGMNGVLMGDLLTTVSNTVDDDRRLFREAGLMF